MFLFGCYLVQKLTVSIFFFPSKKKMDKMMNDKNEEFNKIFESLRKLHESVEEVNKLKKEVNEIKVSRK